MTYDQFVQEVTNISPFVPSKDQIEFAFVFFYNIVGESPAQAIASVRRLDSFTYDKR